MINPHEQTASDLAYIAEHLTEWPKETDFVYLVGGGIIHIIKGGCAATVNYISREQWAAARSLLHYWFPNKNRATEGLCEVCGEVHDKYESFPGICGEYESGGLSLSMAQRVIAGDFRPHKDSESGSSMNRSKKVCTVCGISHGTEIPCDLSEVWMAAEKRMEIIGPNGNDGLHYKGQEPGRIEGVEPQGIKYDTDKPMMDLIPPLMELEVARVLTAGAQKYSPDNWRQVPDLRRRYIAAAKRHINALTQGIEVDDETGLHHAAHAVCCLMFMGEVDLVRPSET